MRVFLLLLLLTLALTVPTQFDLRVQSSILQFADYQLRVQGLCAGYTWAKELAQVISNGLSLKTGEKISLSAQHILECTQTNTDKCYKATYQNILDAFHLISTVGITTDTCYPNRPLELPHTCRRSCHNDEKFDFIYKVPLTKYDNIESIFNLMKKNEKMAAFALLKVNDSFNFYNSLSPVLEEKPTSEFYEFRIAEILGWKNKQDKVILRAGPGQGWGFGGYIDLDVKKYKEYIQEYYYVDLSAFQNNLRIQSQ